MPTWSGIRAKLEKEYLAPSLQGRIQYFATSYSKCPDHKGRAAVRFDGNEILKSSYYEYCLAEGSAHYEIAKNSMDLTLQESYSVARQMVLDGGNFDQHDFYIAFQEFDNQSIDCSLMSVNPIVRMFALLDRRIGKKRLISLKSKMEREPAWLYTFYHLRCDAEHIT